MKSVLVVDVTKSVAVVVITSVVTTVTSVVVVDVVVATSVSVEVYKVVVVTVRGEVVSTTVMEVEIVDTEVATGIERKLEQNGVAPVSFNKSTMSFTTSHSFAGGVRASMGEDHTEWKMLKPRIRNRRSSMLSHAKKEMNLVIIAVISKAHLQRNRAIYILFHCIFTITRQVNGG